MSHPAWVCGLKLRYCHDKSWKLGVTPCVGVWIETRPHYHLLLFTKSHPAWVCGLKPVNTAAYTRIKESHPAWVCGLKHRKSCSYSRFFESHPAWVCGLKPLVELARTLRVTVTPCVGVWIETLKMRLFPNWLKSHPAWVCGLKLS